MVSTTDGQNLDGLIAGETEDGILLRDTGTETLIRKEQIVDIKPSSVSLMPSGLEQGMTREEFADLLAYLQSLK